MVTSACSSSSSDGSSATSCNTYAFSDLSVGAIIGIVIGCLVAVIIVIVLVIWTIRAIARHRPVTPTLQQPYIVGPPQGYPQVHQPYMSPQPPPYSQVVGQHQTKQ